jgi:hypothetical protein
VHLYGDLARSYQILFSSTKKYTKSRPTFCASNCQTKYLKKSLNSHTKEAFESMDDAASDHGVFSTINRWIDFMLRSRSVFFDIRGVRVHMSVRRGCPQDGVLSPLLWNMVTDSLLNRLRNCNFFVQSFADDVVILISGKFLSTIYDLMQRALNCVQNWSVEIGLNVNAHNTMHLWYCSQKGGITI